jgi:hypothetical protein
VSKVFTIMFPFLFLFYLPKIM